MLHLSKSSLYVGQACIDAAAKLKNLPRANALSVAVDGDLRFGGVALGGAIAGAAAGFRTAYAGIVPENRRDLGGLLLRHGVAEYNVEVPLLIPKPRIKFSLTLVQTTLRQRRRFSHFPGSNEISPDDIPDGLLKCYDGIFVGGVGVLKNFEGEALAAFLDRAKALGRMTCVATCHPGRHAAGSQLSKLAPALRAADFTCLSMSEAAEFTGQGQAQNILRVLRRRGANTVLLTRGEKGIALLIRGERDAWHIPPIPIKEADGTGAGDTAASIFFLLCLNMSGTKFNVKLAAQVAAIAGGTVAKLGQGTAALPKFEDFAAPYMNLLWSEKQRMPQSDDAPPPSYDYRQLKLPKFLSRRPHKEPVHDLSGGTAASVGNPTAASEPLPHGGLERNQQRGK